jgi:glycosyltransferase involved in cell wall biosynthesis
VPADRRLRLLLVAPETTGGIGEHVRTLAAALVRRGHRVTVCAPTATLARLALIGAGVEGVPLPLGRTRGGVRATRRLRALAADHDVIHAHGVRAGAQAALAGAGPLVVTWHNAPLGGPLRRAVHTGLERVCARRAVLVLGASDDLVVRARHAGAREARLCPVAAPPLADLPPGRLDVQGGPSTILAVARLHPQKRLDVLIDAVADWPPAAGPIRVLVAGDGPLRDRLRQHASRRSAPVQFLGPRTDVAELLAAADLVVLPSAWEARPLVAQEALRAGVPLVATAVGGVPGLVGDAAVLVPPGDPAALRAAMLQVLTDPDLRRQLRTAGPHQAQEWPTVEQMVDQLESAYLDLTSRVSQRTR